MCQRLIAGGVPGLHMYTLNLERSAVAILENTGEGCGHGAQGWAGGVAGCGVTERPGMGWCVLAVWRGWLLCRPTLLRRMHALASRG